MTAVEWIAKTRSNGYRLHLTDIARRPVWIDAPAAGFGQGWDDLAPAMLRLGIDAVADEVRRERMS